MVQKSVEAKRGSSPRAERYDCLRDEIGRARYAQRSDDARQGSVTSHVTARFHFASTFVMLVDATTHQGGPSAMHND